MSSEPRVPNVGGMHRASCGLLIDDVLEDLPGVAGSQTDVDRGRVTLTSDATTGPSDAEVVATIVDLGYAARRAASVGPTGGGRLRRLRRR